MQLSDTLSKLTVLSIVLHKLIKRMTTDFGGPCSEFLLHDPAMHIQQKDAWVSHHVQFAPLDYLRGHHLLQPQLTIDVYCD